MDTTLKSRSVEVPHLIRCDGSFDVRPVARAISREIKWVLVYRAEGTVIAATTHSFITFQCVADPKGWGLIIADVLIGLRFYSVTLDVPDELRNEPIEGENLQHKLERDVLTGETMLSLLTKSV